MSHGTKDFQMSAFHEPKNEGSNELIATKKKKETLGMLFLRSGQSLIQQCQPLGAAGSWFERVFVVIVVHIIAISLIFFVWRISVVAYSISVIALGGEYGASMYT